MSSYKTCPTAGVPAPGLTRYRVTVCEYVTTTYEIVATDEDDAQERFFDNGEVTEIRHGDAHVDIEEL